MEKGRQLKSFGDIQYTYNANGIRTSKTINGVEHEYTLDGTNIVKETWDGNTLVPLYDNTESVCGITYNGTSYYFLKNLQGDVIAITDATGTVVARYTYDAWGVCTIESDTTDCKIAEINPYRYRSYYLDREIGMYYLQSRYYDPVVGRFVNGDEFVYLGYSSTIISFHVFNYCENNPINFEDETGCFRISIIAPQKSQFNLKKLKGFSKTAKQLVKKMINSATKAKTIICGMFKFLKKVIKTAVDKITLNIKTVFNSVNKWLKSQTKKLKRWFNENVLITTYRGAPVLVLKSMGYDAFSFGMIVIGKKEYDLCIEGKSETLKHEYGHLIQLLTVGLPTFLVMYALPSLACYWFGLPYDLYYSMPWEYTADILGGAKRDNYNYTSYANTLGWIYFTVSFCISYLLRMT